MCSFTHARNSKGADQATSPYSAREHLQPASLSTNNDAQAFHPRTYGQVQPHSISNGENTQPDMRLQPRDWNATSTNTTQVEIFEYLHAEQYKQWSATPGASANADTYLSAPEQRNTKQSLETSGISRQQFLKATNRDAPEGLVPQQGRALAEPNPGYIGYTAKIQPASMEGNLAAPSTHTNPINGLQFASYNDAQIAFQGRNVPHDWIAPTTDASLPDNNSTAVRELYVQKLMEAFVDLDEAQDLDGIKDLQIFQLSSEVETICWKIVEIAENLHRHGPVSLRIFDQTKLKEASRTRKLTFEARISQICQLLRLSKTRCETVLGFIDLDALVACPTSKANVAKASKKLNDKRIGHISEGRKALEEQIFDVMQPVVNAALATFRNHSTQDTKASEGMNTVTNHSNTAVYDAHQDFSSEGNHLELYISSNQSQSVKRGIEHFLGRENGMTAFSQHSGPSCGSFGQDCIESKRQCSSPSWMRTLQEPALYDNHQQLSQSSGYYPAFSHVPDMLSSHSAALLQNHLATSQLADPCGRFATEQAVLPQDAASSCTHQEQHSP